MDPLVDQIKDRVKGAIWGLAAGDRNGGPIRMALRMAESLITQKKFDRDHIIQTYSNWYKGPPYDTERAFDTGTTFCDVFSQYHRGISIDVAVQDVLNKTQNAGINATHRSTPISCCGFFSDDELLDISKQECTITHAHPFSIEVAATFTVLCRKLILGHTWDEAIAFSQKNTHSMEGKNCLQSEISEKSFCWWICT